MYNVYRSTAGSEYTLMFNGQYLSNAEYIDNLVENDTEYCYKVTAQYGTEVGPMSAASCATPEAQTIHEIAYDDGEAEPARMLVVVTIWQSKLLLIDILPR